MEVSDVVSSPADLSASFTPEVADSPAQETLPLEVETEPVSPDAEIDIDELNATGEESEEPAPDDTTHEEPEAEPAQPVAAQPQAEDLPEGVRRGKDRNGKDGLWLTPARYETFHGAHKALQQFAEVAGEPITPEAFDVRHRAYIGQEKLYSDLCSADPAAQSKVLQHFIQEGMEAYNNGEVGSDPIPSLAQTFYQTLQQSHPDAYATLRLQAAKDLIEEMYNEAGTSGNKNLWLSAGHFAKSLGLPFRNAAELEQFVNGQTDPVVGLRQRVQELEGQLNGRQANNQAAQFDSWMQSQRQVVSAALLEEAVRPALVEAQKAWEKFPDAFNDLVVDRLHSAVRKTLLSDPKFQDTINRLHNNAKRAVSAQTRAGIGEQIKQAYVNRANLAVEAHRAKILKDAAAIMQERSEATHQRLKAGAQNRAPSGNGSPVKRSLAPKVDDFDVASPEALSRSLNALFQ